MGMTQAQLDLQIQRETQKSIVVLQKNIERLDGICRIIDGNMRQAHAIVFQDITQLKFRVNFLMNELKNSLPNHMHAQLEERYKAFVDEAKEKLDKEITEAMAAQKKAQEEHAAQQIGKVNKEPASVIQ